MKARSRVAVDEDASYGIAEQYLRVVEYDLRCILWAIAGKKGSKKPEPLPLPSEQEARERADEEAERAMAEVADLLGIGETEDVEGGQDG